MPDGRAETVELTVLCLLRRGNEILLQNRVKKDWRGYALPGGHVEPGESVVAAVVREMKEETGLTVEEPRLCGVKQFPLDGGGRYLVLLFRSEKYAGELRSSAEGEMRWIPRDGLSQVDTVDDLEELLRVMESPELNEFRYVAQDGEWSVELR